MDYTHAENAGNLKQKLVELNSIDAAKGNRVREGGGGGREREVNAFVCYANRDTIYWRTNVACHKPHDESLPAVKISFIQTMPAPLKYGFEFERGVYCLHYGRPINHYWMSQ